MDYKERALQMHRQWKGKIRVEAACSLTDRDDLSTAYTPGVAAPCLEISRDPDLSYTYTRRGDLVAVVTQEGLTRDLPPGVVDPVPFTPASTAKLGENID